MLNISLKNIFFATAFSFFSLMSYAQEVHEPQMNKPEWAAAYQPFRIAGNLYYVGTYDLASYLVTTPQGHILINTGLAASAPMIKANVEALGFKCSDIKILLTSQAHFDHVGAMAAIKKMTGAKFMVDAGDSAVVTDGGSSDYALGGHGLMFQPVKIDRILHDKDVIELGGMKITMLHHPGHTKGSCSFLFDVKDNRRSYKVLIANMPTIVTEQNFNNIPAYPEITRDYTYTLAAMKKLRFDLWVAAHASQFDLHKKHKPGDAYNPAAFMDRKGYDEELADLQKELDEKLQGVFALQTVHGQGHDSLFLAAARTKLKNSKEYLLKVADLMPEDKYGYKPTKEEMSFREQLLHICGNLGWLSSAYLSAEPAPAYKVNEKMQSKDSIRTVIVKTYDYAMDKLDHFNAAQLGDTVKFFAGPMTKLQIINLLSDHQTHHRGQLLVYLRLCGVKPPAYVGL